MLSPTSVETPLGRMVATLGKDDFLSAKCSETSGTGGNVDYVGSAARGRCDTVGKLLMGVEWARLVDVRHRELRRWLNSSFYERSVYGEQFGGFHNDTVGANVVALISDGLLMVGQ
jgi:hypothetical protein